MVAGTMGALAVLGVLASQSSSGAITRRRLCVGGVHHDLADPAFALLGMASRRKRVEGPGDALPPVVHPDGATSADHRPEALRTDAVRLRRRAGRRSSHFVCWHAFRF